MKKREVLQNLERYLRSGNIRTKGEEPFARFFYYWLTRLSIPSDEKYDFYDIAPYLPQLAVDAWEAMRTDTVDAEAVNYRLDYENALGRSMANILQVGEGRMLDSVSGQLTIQYLIKAITGNNDRAGLEAYTYCNAEIQVLQCMFDKFLREVYRRGLFEIISEESTRGMKGTFGPTELRTYIIAGRTMFTFARPKKKGIEVSVSFVAGDSDSLALEAGIQSVQANLATAYNMIEDVISRWPEDSKSQMRLFKPDPKIFFG